MNNNNLHPLSISVIIPVYRGGDNFSQCLESFKNISVFPLEVIVVVDGVDLESYQMATKFTDKVLQLEENQGPATARNRGADIAKGEILFFMDADVTIHHDTLAKILQVFQENPEVSAIIGSYDDSPSASNFLSQYKNLFHHYNHQIGSREASTFWGACGAIKRDIFLKIGGFNQHYRFPSVEDIELGYRLKKKGDPEGIGYAVRILLCKDIYVKHLKKWTIYSLLRADFFYRALPWTELIHQNSSFTNDLNLKYSSRISVILVYLFLILLIPIFWYKQLIFLNIVLIVILTILNLPVYRFFQQKRGLIFTLQVLPWHWFYYFYSGLGFTLGTANFWLKKLITQIK
ncbi:MAG: glycosyltransferase family 2 protein [Geminocystis sp. GBBB08]|nr:glycosyltransferase family 2 protein [Geminocystis sp. GBBB08]